MTVDIPDAVIADRLRPPDAPDPDDLIHETVDPETGEIILGRPEDVPWEIDGRRAAEWAIAEIRAAHTEFAEQTAPAREAIDALRDRADELQEFIDTQGAARDRTVDFFDAKLRSWLRRLRRADIEDGIDTDKATKSIKLAGGAVWSRAGTDHIDVRNARALADWQEEQEDLDTVLVDLEPKPDLRNLRAWINTTGEVPPGVDYTPATEDDRTDGVKLT